MSSCRFSPISNAVILTKVRVDSVLWQGADAEWIPDEVQDDGDHVAC